MQATHTTRPFDSARIKQAAVAIGIVTSLAIGLAMAAVVRDTADTDTGRALAVAYPHTDRQDVFGYPFLEQNPGRAAIVANPHSDRQDVFGYPFMEQNLELPGNSVPVTNPAMDYRFLEMNLDLPGSATMIAPDWRTLEENTWGEHFVLDGTSSRSVAPSADDVARLHRGEVVY